MRHCLGFGILSLIIATMISCGSDGSSGPADSTAPAAISDLAITTVSGTGFTLTWTAPGDDGANGTATSYDLRYSTDAITDATWDAATALDGEPSPSESGTAETMDVTVIVQLLAGGSPGATDTYHFAIKTVDDADNLSELSNIPQSRLADLLPPPAVTDLACTDSIGETMILTWTAIGDAETNATGMSYDLRYHAELLTAANWDDATPITGVPVPQGTGTAETFSNTDVTWWDTYHFAIRVADSAGNWSALSNVPRATPLPPSDWRLIIQEKGRILSCDFSSSTELVVESGPYIEVIDDRIFVARYGGGIDEYDLAGTFVANYPNTASIGWGYFAALPGDQFALMSNSKDSVWIVDADGDLLMAEGIQPTPDNHNQMMEGEVVGNDLIICEDGDRHLLRMDLTTGAISQFKDLSSLGGWIGSVEYYKDRYYVTRSDKLYSFAVGEDAVMIADLETAGLFNIINNVVAGGYSFVCMNFSDAVYRINNKTGEFTLLVGDLDSPEDIDLLIP